MIKIINKTIPIPFPFTESGPSIMALMSAVSQRNRGGERERESKGSEETLV